MAHNSSQAPSLGRNLVEDDKFDAQIVAIVYGAQATIYNPNRHRPSNPGKKPTAWFGEILERTPGMFKSSPSRPAPWRLDEKKPKNFFTTEPLCLDQHPMFIGVCYRIARQMQTQADARVESLHKEEHEITYASIRCRCELIRTYQCRDYFSHIPNHRHSTHILSETMYLPALLFVGFSFAFGWRE